MQWLTRVWVQLGASIYSCVAFVLTLTYLMVGAIVVTSAGWNRVKLVGWSVEQAGRE